MPAETEVLSPKEQALIKSLMATFVEINKDNRITPELMAAAVKQAQKPYEDPVLKERELRAKRRDRMEAEEARKVVRQMQERCPHKHKDGQVALNLQHNFPDGKARGLCPLCMAIIHPAYLEYHPSEVDSRGVEYIVPEHPKYFLVREKEAMS